MSLNNKLILPVALGLSLVSVTALVVWYVFRKEEEETGEERIRASKVNIIEVTVPKSIVPALIGRSGSNIKDIEKKTGALIHFKKFSDKDYDVCILRGRREATQLAETIIHDFIKQQPVIEEDTITVPSWACGKIIGTRGENINEISHRSGARVKIDSAPGQEGPTRNVSLRGTKEQISQAVKLIEACVAQEKCRREIEQSRRSPRHANAPQSQPQPQPQSQSPLSPTPSTANEPEDLTEVGGASIEVYVSAVSSPSRFWVQLVGPQVAQLDELVDRMTEYYGKRENRENHALKQVSVGQVVAAVFRHDGRWYRARVHDIRPNEFDHTQMVADVFFVDYGDSEYVATHELCELRADLLRLRFQAMECFLAGVKPAGKEEEVTGVTSSGQRWDKWHPQAIERFEELTQVARWKPLVSRTCTYKKTATSEGEKEKEIPGIKLFEVTEKGEVNIGATLIAEGWAVEAPAASPRVSPPPPSAPTTNFGDLGLSRILNVSGGARCSSVPKDRPHDRSDRPHGLDVAADNKETDRITTSRSFGSGLETSTVPKSVSDFNLSYSETGTTDNKPQVNGSHEFLHAERNTEGSTETLVPNRDMFKANMNRINSHHSNLEALGKAQDEHNSM